MERGAEDSGGLPMVSRPVASFPCLHRHAGSGGKGQMEGGRQADGATSASTTASTAASRQSAVEFLELVTLPHSATREGEGGGSAHASMVASEYDDLVGRRPAPVAKREVSTKSTKSRAEPTDTNRGRRPGRSVDTQKNRTSKGGKSGNGSKSGKGGKNGKCGKAGKGINTSIGPTGGGATGNRTILRSAEGDLHMMQQRAIGVGETGWVLAGGISEGGNSLVVNVLPVWHQTIRDSPRRREERGDDDRSGKGDEGDEADDAAEYDMRSPTLRGCFPALSMAFNASSFSVPGRELRGTSGEHRGHISLAALHPVCRHHSFIFSMVFLLPVSPAASSD
jgi:hypothetical protein